MSTVNIRLNEAITVPGFVPVTVESVLIDSLNVVSGSHGVLPGAWSDRTDVTGFVAFLLETGRYKITAQSVKGVASGQRYVAVIDVPNDSNVYEHTNLLVPGAAGPFTQPIVTQVNATDATFGILRLTSKGNAIPENFDSIAEARGCASARLKLAKRVSIFGAVTAGDGGGGEYFFKAGGAEADDGAAFLRPSDYAGAGADQGTLVKYA